MNRAQSDGAVLAFDLGGTKLHAALVDPTGRLLADRVVPTAASREDLLATFRETVEQLQGEVGPGTRLVGTGVGTAGVIRKQGGVITYAPNLPFHDFPLGEWLAGFCPQPVTVLNDGRAAALGEYAFGELAGRDPMLCLFYGTGIGIGVVVEGRILEGRGNCAGEIGHTIFDPGGRTCGCGKTGCIETLCGGGPITLRAKAEIGDPPDERWTVGAVARLAAEGNEAACRIRNEALTAFQVLTANAVTLFNPGALVLGGGVLEGWPELLAGVTAGLERMVHPAVLADLQIARSRLGSRAILLGAAEAARRDGGA